MPCMGAIPILTEVEDNSFNLDPKKLPAAFAAGKEAGVDVVGIVGVSLFGQPANYAAIKTFADANRLWLVDDAACSKLWCNTEWPACWPASCRCNAHRSFFPRKASWSEAVMSGAVFTDNAKIAEIIRSCRVHGMGHNK